jgi:transposase
MSGCICTLASLKQYGMAAKPIAMEQLKQVLKLYREGQSIKGIVRLTGLSRNTVRSYLARASEGVGDRAKQSDGALSNQFYNQDIAAYKGERYRQLVKHFEGSERELSRPGVTRQLLWREYMDLDPKGYAYSQYCYHLQRFLGKKDVVMHLEYRPGEQTMVDFAGKKYHWVDGQTGECRPCEVFVATLPFSGLIFCIAVESQKTHDLLDASNEMLHYIGGVTETILCDNMRTAVTRSDRYEPVFTDLCYQLSEHYETTFSATRPGKPRDKAMVEKAVNLVYKYVYAPLRNRTFTSLSEINHYFRIQIDLLNQRRYKGSSFSRRDLFEEQEKPLLRGLPPTPCLLKKCAILTVQRNYHIQLRENGLYYSVPWQHVGQKVKVWYDSKTVEIYLDHRRIAMHVRRPGRGYNTIGEHMPLSHKQAREAKGWTKEELLTKATRIGTGAVGVAELILGNSIYMEQNYKACFGMLMLEKRYGSQRLEAACALAMTGTRISYTMIKNILAAGMDNQIQVPMTKPLPVHDNIRGPEHYQ